MKYYTIVFILLFCGIFKVSSQSNITLRINPDNARGATMKEIIDSVIFIPLESTKESRFNLIDQLEVTDSFYIILDKLSQSILIFKRDGSFHTRVRGKMKTRYFSYFSIIKDSNQIAVINSTKNELEIYDFDGNLIRIIQPPINARSVFVFDDGSMVFNMDRTNRDGSPSPNLFSLAYTSKTGRILKYMAPFELNNQDDYDQTSNPLNPSGENGTCMFSLPFDYNVYQLNATGINHTYQFIFNSKYSLPPNFANDPSFHGKRQDFVYQTPDNKEKYHTIYSIFKIGNTMLFSALNSRMILIDDINFLYNLNTGDLISFNKVTGDSSTYYLPLLNSVREKVNAVFGNKIYTSLSSLKILSVSKELNKKITYPFGLNKLINSGTKMDNPVIVQFKLRENL